MTRPPTTLPMTIDDCLKTATIDLNGLSENPRLDAEILLAFTLNKQRAYLYTWPDREIPPDTRIQFMRLVSDRKKGQPVAYLTGEQEFWSLSFRVTPGVLIPRPETEVLVRTVLDLLPNSSQDIVDLGTGSGAIAVALATERKQWNICAVDQSNEALEVARTNARKLGVDCISFVQGDWFEPLGNGLFHAIVSNPPYIESGDPHLKALRYEPQSALHSGVDGFDDIRKIIEGAAAHLHAGGYLIFEHGYNQRDAILEILEQNNFKTRHVLNDLSGLPRVIASQPLPTPTP